MNTPRTDERAGYCDGLEVVPAAFARQLELELNACRIDMAAQCRLEAYHADKRGRIADVEHFTAAAAHLRDLETPLDVSRL